MPRYLLSLDSELIAWVDAEGLNRDRSRQWLVNRVLWQYRRRLDRERKRRRERHLTKTVKTASLKSRITRRDGQG